MVVVSVNFLEFIRFFQETYDHHGFVVKNKETVLLVYTWESENISRNGNSEDLNIILFGLRRSISWQSRR